jgi:hypothetical protein
MENFTETLDFEDICNKMVSFQAQQSRLPFLIIRSALHCGCSGVTDNQDGRLE